MDPLLNLEEFIPQDDGRFDRSLAYGTLLTKTLEETEETWKIAGIASDETQDEHGDVILRKALDLSYAQKRGYINWDHSRQPEDQIGYLNEASIVSGNKELSKLEKKLDLELPKTATVYVEGVLYKHMPKALSVVNMIKSAPDPSRGPGLSLDGAVARNVESRSVVKAFVRGVAITPIPAHTNTLCRLVKSLRDYSTSQNEQTGSATVPLAKGLSLEEATLWVLKQKPNWTYELATQVVRYTIRKKERGE